MTTIRLDPLTYEQGHCFSITLATANRTPHFRDEGAVSLALDALRAAAAKYGASVSAYCFMPDHLHLLASVPEGISLVQFVRQFKQLTAYRFRRLPYRVGEALWQRGFYDHALRGEDQLIAAANYIWANPVRAGLVADHRHSPYSGSLEWDRTAVSGSEDPDLQGLDDAAVKTTVGEGLQTLAKSH